MQQYESENTNFKYIPTVTNCFSKYGWYIPSKDKMGKEIINAFMHLFKNRRPKKVHIEKGKEFVMRNFRVFF